MNRIPHLRQSLTFAFLLGFAFSLPGPLSFTPALEAASASATARLIKKLKKQITSLKKQVLSLNTQLAAAKAPAPFIEMVTVGNAGNAADPLNSGTVPGIGTGASSYRIGKYEVTNTQYAAFLNAAAATDTNGLYSASMGSEARGGITRFGTSGSFGYAAKAAMGDKPVNFVSFWDACRFSNWLHNGRPTGPQGATTTEFGAYDLTVPAAITNNTVTRLTAAKFFVPSENEWYKAAYHDPRTEAAGGPPGGDHYWLYPTKSDAVPTEATANVIGEINNDDGNIANHGFGADWNGQDGNVTTVGSGGPGSATFYGAFDQGGNLYEWNDSVISGSFRGRRGGSWDNVEALLRSSTQDFDFPALEFNSIGFRVASP